MMRLLELVDERPRSALIKVLLAAALFSFSVAFGQGTGYWHTSGNRILDQTNAQVRIAGINWYGFETGNAVVGGLYAQDYKDILRTVKSQGFNTLRLPLSSKVIEKPSTTPNIQYRNEAGPINADLKGLDSLQVLDRIVAYAGQLGLKVILDHHRSEPGGSASQNGLWYSDSYPESAWIKDWVMLARRYQRDSTVIGFDLHNEPHTFNGGGACWDCGGSADWHLAAQRAGNAVLEANPKLLIFVEGVDTYRGDAYWWGGNLEGVQTSPVILAVSNRLVYSAHDYGPHEAPQRWFNQQTTYASLAGVWTKHWGFISQNNIAPVWLSEFGTTNNAADLKDNTAGTQGQWFQSLIHYLNTAANLNWNYWALNGEDVYGLLDVKDSPTPVSLQKQAMLTSIRLPTASQGFVKPSPTSLALLQMSGTK